MRPRCECLVESKTGYYYHPTMKRMYIHVKQNDGRRYRAIGWFCPHCQRVIFDERTEQQA